MGSAFIYLVSALAGIFLYRKYKDYEWKWCTNKESLKGKVVLITGGNCGLGYETAKELAKRKAKVILACRNLDSAKLAAKKIQDSVKDCPELDIVFLDLADLESIRQSAKQILKTYDKIHILINNAGVYTPERGVKTKDGFEIHFGVNHLGHFLFTNLLVDILKASAPSRIIIVSSKLHESGQVNFDEIHEIKNATSQKMNPGYKNSKLANYYFGNELSKRLQNTGVDVYTCCPGFTHTGLFRNVAKWYHYIIFAPLAILMMRTARQGAQTIIYCATEPSLTGQSGHFYRNCNVYQSKAKLIPEISKKLWDTSVQLTKLNKS